MSVQAISWAMGQVIPQSGAKFVLVALANYADAGGYCFPSQEALARDTSQGPRTVRRHLEYLEEAGFIQRTRRRRQDGTWDSDTFQLTLPTSGQNDQRPNWPEAKTASGQKRPQPAAKLATEPSREPSGSPPLYPPQGRPAAPGRESAAERCTERPVSAVPKSAPRRPDPFWDAMVDALELRADLMTSSERGRVNAALKQIREAGGRPEEIPRAVANYQSLYPNADCTPTAIAGNWSRLLSGNGKVKGKTAEQLYGRLS